MKNGLQNLLLHVGWNAGAVVPNPDLHTVAKVFGGRSQGRLVVAAICFRLALGRRIEAVRDPIETEPV